MEPIVSVIIPAYNCEKYISGAVLSALSQTTQEIEVIVVDDGSTDGIKAIIAELCLNDRRLHYFFQDNQGVSSARNNGYARSKGKFISFLDGDDVWLPDNLELKIRKFQTGDFGLVHSDGVVINELGQITDQVLSGKEGMVLNDLLSWRGTQIPGPSSILVRRETMEKTGLFDTALSTSADQDFFFRIASNYQIGRVDKITWQYRLHGNNMHSNISRMEKDVIYVYHKAQKMHLFFSEKFRKECFARMYVILAASWAGDGKNKIRGLYFLIHSIVLNPSVIIEVLHKTISRMKKTK
jgi:glycosyltransferase involved in cell wall biosynthesis